MLFVLVIVMGSQFPSAGQTLRAYLNAGDEAMQKSRFAEAIEYYKKALEFETEDVTISYKMAEASRMYKDYEKAAAWYGKIVLNDKDKRYPLALFYYAEMKKYLGMYAESCRLFERYTTEYPNDSTYTGIKARKESSDCPEVMKLAERNHQVEVKNAGSPVNSNFSEFGASMMGDSVLYFSSLKFLYSNTDKKSDNYYVSRILKSSPKAQKNQQPAPLSTLINESGKHNGNAAFSPDQRFMIFSRCTQPEGNYDLRCELYITKFDNGKFSKPEKIGADINLDSVSSSQPGIAARGAEGYRLYFVSDRPGGSGRNDIWVSDISPSLVFSPAVNAGPVINTFDDELTPFFDNTSQILYFSSYGHAGLGGQDIFKSSLINNELTSPENLGPGYNTSVNDVYFTVSSDGKSGTMSSNRQGSMFILAKTCCYDIYYHKQAEADTTVETDSVAVIIAEADSTDPGNKAYYDDFLPLELYFDNDEPDKKTMAVTTGKSYDRLYSNYMGRIGEYKTNFAGTLKPSEKSNAEKQIDDFFNNVVTGSWNRLNGFCSKVEKALLAGVDIELEVRGRTSPLADNQYNVNLSRRRIASLVNFMKSWNSGSLKKYFDDGSLKVVEVAAGETLVQTGVSDMLTDKRNSVYNPAAAIERRIELINVNLSQPEK